MVKRILAGILIPIIFCCSVGAGEIGARPMVLDIAYDGFLSVLASVFSTPKVSLQGVGVHVGEMEKFPATITYTRSDISSYYSSLSLVERKSTNWYEKLWSRSNTSRVDNLVMFALEALKDGAYLKGQYIIDGSVKVEKLESTYQVLLSLIVSGLGFDLPCLVEADVSISSSDQGLVIVAENISIDENEYQIENPVLTI